MTFLQPALSLMEAGAIQITHTLPISTHKTHYSVWYMLLIAD